MNQYNISFKETGKREGGNRFLVWGVAAFAAVSLGGMIWGIYNLYRSTQPQQISGVIRHFQCTKCNAAFEIPASKYAEWLSANSSTPGIYGHADCPKCGAKLGGTEMQRCTKCEQYFLPSQTGVFLTDQGYVCPKCQPAPAAPPVP